MPPRICMGRFGAASYRRSRISIPFLDLAYGTTRGINRRGW